MPQTKLFQRRHGGTVVLFTILLVLVIGMAAFAIDIARVELVRSQLQTAVDAGALAGGLQLKKDPEDIPAAVEAAQNYIQLNRVGFSRNVATEDITVELGYWDPDLHSFIRSNDSPSSVRVIANAANEQFTLAQIFGRSAFSVLRQSVATAPRDPLDIILVLDLSESMASQGRIEALRAAAPEFLTAIENAKRDDRLGVMCYGVQANNYNPPTKTKQQDGEETRRDPGFSPRAYTASPAYLFPNPEHASSDWVGVLEAEMSADFAAIRRGALSPSSLLSGKYGGGTPIGAAIRDGAHYLDTMNREKTRKLMVLMSDGQANKPNGNGAGYARSMAGYAARLDTKIHTISLGSEADVGLIRDIAGATGGRTFAATGEGARLAERLKSVFRSIANDINRTTLVQ